MNQERFDDLARGLATKRLSRRRVLKGLAMGVFLGLGGALSPRYTHAAMAQQQGQQDDIGTIWLPQTVAPPRPCKYCCSLGCEEACSRCGRTGRCCKYCRNRC
jgi:hypothetical protein